MIFVRRIIWHSYSHAWLQAQKLLCAKNHACVCLIRRFQLELLEQYAQDGTVLHLSDRVFKSLPAATPSRRRCSRTLSSCIYLLARDSHRPSGSCVRRLRARRRRFIVELYTIIQQVRAEIDGKHFFFFQLSDSNR